MAVDPANLILGPAWLYWRAPDGRCFWGEGPGIEAAVKNAHRRWRGRPQPLTVNGHEYNRRRLARQRRKRRPQ